MAAREGDSVAADELWAAAGRRLKALALALAVPPEFVPDLVQEVLVAAWRNLARFDPTRGSFIGWLAPGLRGRVKNRARQDRRRRALLGRLRVFRFASSASSSAEADAIDARATLSKLLAVLTERQRDVVSLYEIAELSGRETARILGISEASVRSIARDARAKLKKEAIRLSASPESSGRAASHLPVLKLP